MLLPRFAFIGSLSHISPWLLQAVARVGRCEAVCGTDSEQHVDRIRARWAFSDLGAMLDEIIPDAVVVCLPHAQRAAAIKQCLSAGVGVLTTAGPGAGRDLTRINTLAQLAARPVLAAPPIRYSPAVLLARRLLESGKLGRPVSLLINSTWRRTASGACDAADPITTDQVYEAADLVHYLLGPIDRVRSVVHADGALLAIANTPAAVPVSIALHAGGPPELVGLEIELRGVDGTHVHITRDGRLTCRSGSRVDACHSPSLAAADPTVELGYEGLLRAFMHYLHESPNGRLIGDVPDITQTTESILRSHPKRPLPVASPPTGRPHAFAESRVAS